ncbi:MAG: uracil-DNA glycosylase family protein [Pseudomonadota bacterium]
MSTSIRLAQLKAIADVAAEARACRYCEDHGILPAARPVFQLPASARIGIFGQAPGNLAHIEGRPFSDPSGVRLRDWLGVDEALFYDSGLFAVIPMALCFPGYDGTGKTGKGGDRPPPKVCAEIWRKKLLAPLSGQLEIVLLIGNYAQAWHLGDQRRKTLTETVQAWRNFADDPVTGAKMFVLPHPSWRNTQWLKKNPWFETEVLPEVRDHITRIRREHLPS